MTMKRRSFLENASLSAVGGATLAAPSLADDVKLSQIA